MEQVRRSRICVVGCGHWGKNLARNFSQLGLLYAICESDPARLDSFAEQYPEAKAYGSFTQMLSDPAVEGVALAMPAEQHFGIAMTALKAGKDVFVESNTYELKGST